MQSVAPERRNTGPPAPPVVPVADDAAWACALSGDDHVLTSVRVVALDNPNQTRNHVACKVDGTRESKRIC